MKIMLDKYCKYLYLSYETGKEKEKKMKYEQSNGFGELQGHGLGSGMGNLSGEVECPECGMIFDAGTGAHSDSESFVCPYCGFVFDVKWEEVK